MPHRRECRLTIRCTPQERAEWHSLAAEKGTDLSEYVRHMLQNRAALSHNSEQLDLSYMDDEEVVAAHRMLTDEATRRLERLRRISGNSAVLVLVANGITF